MSLVAHECAQPVEETYRPEANNSFVKTTLLGSVDKLVQKGNSQKGSRFPFILPIRALNPTAYNKSPLTTAGFYFKHRHVWPLRLTNVLQVGFNQLIFLLFLTNQFQHRNERGDGESLREEETSRPHFANTVKTISSTLTRDSGMCAFLAQCVPQTEISSFLLTRLDRI